MSQPVTGITVQKFCSKTSHLKLNKNFGFICRPMFSATSQYIWRIKLKRSNMGVMRILINKPQYFTEHSHQGAQRKYVLKLLVRLQVLTKYVYTWYVSNSMMPRCLVLNYIQAYNIQARPKFDPAPCQAFQASASEASWGHIHNTNWLFNKNNVIKLFI